MATESNEPTNSERFLLAFNRIERRLADISHVDEHHSFGEKLRVASRREPVVGHIERQLRELAELRNALVHSDRLMPLAEPHDDVVEEIERYQRLITDPPQVGSRFSRRVAAVRADDPLRLAVRLMRERGFSQLPVHDASGACIALLTGATVARWLGGLGPAQPGEKAAPVDLDATTVEQVLEGGQPPENYVFLPPEATLFDALWEFESHQRQGHRLDAILISHGGRPEHALIGIITPRDLPRIMMQLEYPEGGGQDQGDSDAR